MTVKSNYMIAIATLSDWLKRLAPVFQPMKSKTKTNHLKTALLTADFTDVATQFLLSFERDKASSEDWY